MRLRRTLTAAALALVAVTGLTACQTKVGQAASVDSQRLSDSQLSSYVQSGAKPYQNSGSTVYPKVFALQVWLRNAVFVSTVEANGGPITDTEAKDARAAVLGTHDISEPEQSYVKLGYTPKLGDLIIDQTGALVILVERLAHVNAQRAVALLQSGQASDTLLLQAVDKVNPDVSVSSRYGTWQPAHLSLTTGPGAGLPGFVTYPAAAASVQ